MSSQGNRFSRNWSKAHRYVFTKMEIKKEIRVTLVEGKKFGEEGVT